MSILFQTLSKLSNLSSKDEIKTVSNSIKHINDSLQDIATKIADFKPRIAASKERIARDKEKNARPLKMTLNSEHYARLFLKDFSRERLSLLDGSFSEITVYCDRAKKESDHLNSLRKSLQERIDNGKRDLTIKVVDGVPRIVNYSKLNGGSVLVVVDRDIPSSLMRFNTQGIECVVVGLSIGHGLNIVLSRVYIPPAQPLQSILVNTIDSSSVRLRKELASLLRGNQCNGVKNNHLVLLDLVFSSIPDTDVVEDCQLLVNIDHQHPALNGYIGKDNKSHAAPSLMRFRDLTTTEPELMNSYFAQFFSSSFSKSKSNQRNLVLPITIDSEDLMADRYHI
ncbi:hypothetical protein J6590_071837 [Homalodisca vitripennis]|nr:hypothetical protein J6590_071837 [Homalodisca vitripennis]